MKTGRLASFLRNWVAPLLWLNLLRWDTCLGFWFFVLSLPLTRLLASEVAVIGVPLVRCFCIPMPLPYFLMPICGCLHSARALPTQPVDSALS